MPRRIEIELTSTREDGTWTWRAAGAKQPKGELDGALLPAGAEVGAVLKADAEFMVDGIEIVAVLAPKAARKEPERLVVVGTRKDEPLVTTQLAPKGRGGRDGRRDRDRDGGDRRDRGPRDRSGRGDRGDRPGGDRRPRGPRPDPVPERPRPKRLRPGRTHRAAVLEQLPAEQRPVAEQVLRGGVPAVRAAIDEQNRKAREGGQPEVPADQLVAMAEQLLPRLREAEWKDRAEAAVRDLDELDLRDLRSVVVAADGVAKDPESVTQVEALRTGLARRVEEEQANWLADIRANLDAGRFVRALRLTSRPPKAGAPLPEDLSAQLVEAVSTGLTSGTNQDLWAAAVDALAVSPVRNRVTPASRPESPGETLVTAVRRAADRLPAIAALFGVEPMTAKERRASRPGKARVPAPPPVPTEAAVGSGSAGGAPEPAPSAPAEPESVEPESVEDVAAEPESVEPESVEPETAEDGPSEGSVEDLEQPEEHGGPVEDGA